MTILKKTLNKKSEEDFHDEWAASVKIRQVKPMAQFESVTASEYKALIRLAGDVSGKKILNLGCGLGEEAVYLAKKGAVVTAVDISKKMLDVTKALAKKYKVESNVSCHHVSTESMKKFKEKTFDMVIGCNILHHVDIKKTIHEVKRVLKNGGKGMFVEPLCYNPLINIYRIMGSNVRTDGEHPLSFQDIRNMKKIFPRLEHYEFHFFTLLIFVWFFVVERIHPNQARYWKKFVNEGEKYKKSFIVLSSLDNMVLNLLPFLGRFCWVTLIEIEK